jgi:folate-binding protein YgfZ
MGTWSAIERDVVTVTGPDARTYLHGQVSQDVQSLVPGGSRWTLVLAPNGRVEVLARLLCVADDRFELDTEAGFGDALRERLNRFRIRVAAELEQSTATLYVNCAPSVHETAPAAHRSAARVGWWDRGAWLAELPPGTAADGTFDDYEQARVAAGWPAMGREIVPGERIPGEVAVVPVAVDFTKGCYPGQELVERMDSRRAEAPRQLRVLTRAEAEEVGAEITTVAGGMVLAYVKRGAAAGDAPGPARA